VSSGHGDKWPDVDTIVSDVRAELPAIPGCHAEAKRGILVFARSGRELTPKGR